MLENKGHSWECCLNRVRGAQKIQKMIDLVEETSSFVVNTSDALKKNNILAMTAHKKLNQLNADKIDKAAEMINQMAGGFPSQKP